MGDRVHPDEAALKEIDEQIDAWTAVTAEMTGKVVEERKPWITSVTEDAICHFAQGTDDDNPLWTNTAYARNTRHGKLVAPPAFVFANRYPTVLLQYAQ